MKLERNSIDNKHRDQVNFQLMYIPLDANYGVFIGQRHRYSENWNCPWRFEGRRGRGKKEKKIINSHLNGETTIPYFRESVWFLYSRIVLGGRFKTRRSVSRIRLVVA
jgi:hypothetical protein